MQPQGRGPEHGHLPVQVSLCRLNLLVGRRQGRSPELLIAQHSRTDALYVNRRMAQGGLTL